MKKEDQLLFGTSTTVPIRNGESSILIIKRRNKPRDLMKTSVSTSTDHSTSNQECYSEELLSLLELQTLYSRDTQRTELSSNSTSTEPQRLLSHRDTKTDHLTSTVTEMTRTSE